MALTSILSWRGAPDRESHDLDDLPKSGTVACPRNAGPEDLIRAHRSALVLSPEYNGPYNHSLLESAWTSLQRDMALVPAGEVDLEPTGNVSPAAEQRAVTVEPAYIDRYAVACEDYARFVASLGYEEMELWPEEVWPSVVQFVDQTGYPGPRYWSHGEPPRHLLRHPVTGICWYEACAYARWMGKRLPSSAEWQRAASWPAGLDGRGKHSRYPWGNSFDPARANTWAGGRGATVPVEEFETGSTPNGVYQLCGNVWEWVDNGYAGPAVRPGVKITFDQPMGEIRGGAYDTYFESQTTTEFRTGQPLLYRGPNVGFRCMVSADRLRQHPV